ncbi:MAG: response regulator, partial [Bacteroidales bacterium]|nr:response regulator [Bacteroidales bacterium]
FKILNCLINNAVKFTNEGEVNFGFKVAGKFLEFYVKDTGIGIDPKDQNVIFDRFSKIRSDKTNLYGGTGLGLAISKAFVESLGGKIRFNSTPNMGTAFYFTIPLKVTAKDKENKDHDNYLSNIKPGRQVLVVEDEIMNYIYLEEILSDIDAIIFHAKTGKEALKIFQKKTKLNLVLMDIKLPDTNGYILTKQFKSIRPNLPIIAQTAYAMEGDRQKALEAGCDDYISKPIDSDKLFGILNKFINKS